MGTAVVIPQRNRGGARLWNCLNALRRQTVPPEEVIVSDLSSDPGQLDNIQGITRGLRCTFLQTPHRGKFNRSVAINAGIRAARSEHVLILDVDAVAAPDCVESFEAAVGKNVLVLAEHRRGRAPEHEEDLSSNWAAYFTTSWVNPWPRIAAGMLMGATRWFWTRIGAYDERFSGWGAEDDFVVWKAEQVGSVTWIDRPLMIHQDHPDVAGKEEDRGANHTLFETLKRRNDWPSRWGTHRPSEHTKRSLRPEPSPTPKYNALFFLDSAPPFLHAGAEYAALGLARALQLRGRRVAIVTKSGTGVHKQYGVPIYAGAPDWDTAGIRDHIDRFEASACISQYGSTPAVAVACKGSGARHAVYCHTHHSYSGHRPSAADLWMFTSEALWEESGRFGGGRALPVRPQLLLERITSSAQRRRRRGWKRNAVTALNTSRSKGGDVLLALAARMPGQRFLVIQGGYGDPVEELEWLANVETYPVTGDLSGFYAQSLVHLVPSHSETYGMTATESLLAGVQVLATDMPSLREAAFGEGVLLPDGDVDVWHTRLLAALESQPLMVDVRDKYSRRVDRDLDALERRLW